MKVFEILHPDFNARLQEWSKWRLTYEGGRAFIDAYLQKLSKREDNDDFIIRKSMTYCPAFAKVGVNEIKDSIYQRMGDITRVGGSESYQEAVSGLNGGIDLEGSSMNYFMGCKILPELLTMQKVGIFVDMPDVIGENLLDKSRPYVYIYNCEKVRCWVDETACPNEYQAILLEDKTYNIDPESGFPIGYQRCFRKMWKENGVILTGFYNSEGKELEAIRELKINRIPFVVVEISESLLTDVADYQIALLNLASTDMNYQMNMNFSLYTEQYDARTDSPHLRPAGEASEANTAKMTEVQIGPTRGRRYPVGTDRPAFISPSGEPMSVSMAKQEQMKSDIRQLLKLAVSSLRGPKMASAESKKEDSRSLESGLSYIGMSLELAERKIAELWALYDGKGQIATINYPETYSLKSEEDRREESKSLNELMITVPSLTYQKAMAKRIASIMLGTKVSREDLQKINSEIDESKIINIDPITIQGDVEAGLVSTEFASEARGYPKGEAAKSADDHAERLARIAASQTEGLGIADGNHNPKRQGKNDKKASRDTTQDGKVSDKTRGDGK